MNPTFKKVWNSITIVIIALVAALAILLVGVKLVGFKVYTVLSASMEPTYMTGSVIYVRDVNTDALKSGDPITFYLSGDTVATHRIVEVIDDEEGLRFRTKGDNNDVEDATPVKADAVIGKPVFSVPFLGYLSHFIQTPAGRMVAIAVGLLVVLMVFLPDFLAPKEEKKACNTSESSDTDK